MTQLASQAFAQFAATLGFPSLSPHKQRELAEEIGPLMLERFLLLIEPKLSEEDRESALRYIDEEDVEGLITFLKVRVSDFDRLIPQLF